MSVLEIGQYSRQYQGSPGCRKYVNPFLTNEEKQSIQRQKERSQNNYRQILMDQIKKNQRQKQAQKKKEMQEDIKHERLFYQKLKLSHQMDSKVSGRKNIVGSSFTKSVQNDIPTYEANIFKKTKQLTLPPLLSTSVNSHRKGNQHFSTIHTKLSQPQSNYLKYKSLIQIGSRLREEGMTRSMLMDNSIQDLRNQDLSNQDLSRIGKKKFDKTYYKPEKRYKELRNQLQQKEIEVYELLEKSSQMIHSTKNPLRQVKKRLNTQPVCIPEQFQDDNSHALFLKSRLKTQFQPYVLNQSDEFYRLPSRSSYFSIDQSSIHHSLVQQSNTLPSQVQEGMMRIEEQNPQNESNGQNTQQTENPQENYK